MLMSKIGSVDVQGESQHIDSNIRDLNKKIGFN